MRLEIGWKPWQAQTLTVRLTDGQPDRHRGQRDSLSLPAAAAGDIQSNCLKNAIKMYDKKREEQQMEKELEAEADAGK